jgi:hypothetical protein
VVIRTVRVDRSSRDRIDGVLNSSGVESTEFAAAGLARKELDCAEKSE